MTISIAQVPKRQLTMDGFECIEKSMGRILMVSSLGYNMGTKTIQFGDMNWDKTTTRTRAPHTASW